MGWSWRIGRIAGIDVYVHATFALLLLFVGWVAYGPRHNWGDVLYGIIFILCLFGIIVLHELGHALTARRFGIKTRDITLLPIGGVARLEKMPEDPKQELLVALAGPAVNVVLALILLPIVLGFGLMPSTFEEFIFDQSFLGRNLLFQLLAVNVTLVLFNLLPAFPMDGGRVLRALLAMSMDYVQATRTAAMIGQMMAIGFGLIGLFVPGMILLLLVAVFVWAGAAAEAGAVQFKAGLSGIPVGHAMIREFTTLVPDDTLATASRRILDGFQADFPIVAGGKVVGILTRDAVLQGLSEAGPQGRVEPFMRTDFETVGPREMMEPVLEKLKTGCCAVLPVLDNGELVGLVTPENVSELVMIREAVRGRTVASEPVPVERTA
jgi:Zn-dependent protease/predicted transcriptional regulator